LKPESLLKSFPAFRNLFIGQAISQIGDAIYFVSFMFLVKKLTRSDAMVGVVGILETLPFLLLSLYAGVIVDRVDRRLVLIYTDLISAAILMSMGIVALIAGTPQVWSLLVGTLLLSTCRVLFFPARNSCIPRLVPEDRVSDAFALNIGTSNLVMLSGTAFAATILAKLYQESILFFFVTLVTLNALSFLLSAYFVWKLPPVIPQRETEAEDAKTEIKEGFKFVKVRKDLVTLMITRMLFSLGIAPFFVTHVAANDQWFGGKPQFLAWCECAFFAGMVFGTWLVARIPPKRPGFSFCSALFLVAIFVGAMAFSREGWVYIAWNIACGIVLPYAEVPITTYLQLSVTDGFRGRVNALQNMLATSMMPIGMGSAGLLVQNLGLVTTFLIMGTVMAGACLIGMSGKEFRNARA
jgi:hypothetical protein